MLVTRGFVFRKSLLVTFVMSLMLTTQIDCQEAILKDVRLAENYEKKGDSLYFLAYYKEALDNYEESTTLFKRLANNKKYINSRLKAIRMQAYLSQKEEVLCESDIIFSEIEELSGNRVQKVQALMNLGLAYYKGSKFEESNNYYLEALKLNDSNNESFSYQLVIIYNALAKNFSALINYDEVQKYSRKTIGIFKQNPEFSKQELAEAFDNLGLLFHDLNNIDSSLHYFQKAKKLRIGLYDTIPHPALMASHNRIGMSYWKRGFLNMALKEYSEAQRIGRSRSKVLSGNMVGLKANIGILAIEKGDFNKAEIIFKEVITESIEIYDGELNPSVIRGYYTLGVVYAQKGSYNLALEYYNKANKLAKSLSKTNAFITTIDNAIINIIQAKGENRLAVNLYTKSIEKLKIHVERSSPELAQAYQNMGNAYYDLNDFINAEMSYKNALRYSNLAYGKDHYNNSLHLNSLGNINVQKNEYQKALKYFQEAIKLTTKVFSENHPKLSFYLNNISELYFLKGEDEKCIKYAKQAINANKLGLDQSNMKLDKYFDLKTLLYSYYFIAKANLSSYKESQKISYLLESENMFSYCDTLINELRKVHLLEGDKIQIGEISKKIYEGAIQACKTIFLDNEDQSYLEKAFYYSERSKAIILLLSLNELSSTNYSGIPDSLLNVERETRLNLNYYKARIMSGKTKLGFQDSLFNLRMKYEQLINIIRENYTQYYRFKYEPKVVSSHEIIGDLDEQTAMISYFVGDSSIIVFSLKKDGLHLKDIKRDFDLEELVINLNTGITEFWELPTAQKDEEIFYKLNKKYTDNAYLLYEKLLSHLLEKNDFPNRLIINPDDVLHKVSFTSLIDKIPTTIGAFEEYSFLAHKFSISYTHSASLTKKLMLKENNNTNIKVLGFAPSFGFGYSMSDSSNSSTIEFSELKYNSEEVEVICNLFGGQKYLNKQATKNAFLSEVQSYPVIHLATHTEAYDSISSPYIVFHKNHDNDDNLLFEPEIYSLSLDADMVVVSACEAGKGKLYKGEGLLNLTRSFIYAGAKSIAISHWSVPDKSTSEIMVDYYKGLHQGLPKDKALQNSQIQYLQSNIEKRMHPYFWSSMVLIGNNSTLVAIPSKNLTLYFIIGLLFIVILVWVLRKKLKTGYFKNGF